MEARNEPSRNEREGNMFVRTLKRLLMHPARVVSVEILSEHFRLISLQGDALKTLEWIPGQQIQVTTGAGLEARTYTPIDWDHDGGVTRLLVFLHGNGPGCTWARTVQPGSLHDFLGPTKPLKLDFTRALTLFGDETTFGLGLALQNACIGGIKTRFCFEVSNVQESQDVLTAIGLRNAVLAERSTGRDHFPEVARVIATAAGDEHQIVLSGNARSIQELKKATVKNSNLIIRPYWSQGKTGMS